MTQPTRRGFTLIEILVVVAIIGILIALIVPAVLASREAGRRATCRNNLRQIGQALSGFHAAHGHYPEGIKPDGVLDRGRLSGKPFAFPDPYSCHFQLLPYLEQTPLYNGFNVNPPGLSKDEGDFRRYSLGESNTTASSIRLAVFLCPSDEPLTPGVNYRACTGPEPHSSDGTPWPGGAGAFPALRSTSARDFADGLSQTVGFAERSNGGGDDRRFDARRDIWYSGLSSVTLTPSSDQMARVCASRVSSPPFWAQSGRHWVVGSYADTLYNHVAGPNAPSTDCAANAKPIAGSGGISGGSISARSFHSSGVQTLLMDGSVRSFSETTRIEVWRAMASRSRGEVISSS